MPGPAVWDGSSSSGSSSGNGTSTEASPTNPTSFAPAVTSAAPSVENTGADSGDNKSSSCSSQTRRGRQAFRKAMKA